MRVGLSLMRSDQLNTFHFFCPICFKFKRQFKCVPQEFRHFTFTHFGSFAILPSPVSLPFPNETQFMKHRLESRDIRAWSRFPRCVPDDQPRHGALCEIEAGLSKICRHILFREVVIIFWEFVSFHARKSTCVPSLRSYGGFQSLQDGVMNITECFPMRKRRSIDKTPGRSHDNSGSSFGNLAILYMNC